MSPITHLIAGVPVTDLDAGIDWYTRFFGRPPDLRVGNEVLWDIDEHATLFIEPNAAQAGAGRITLAVTGLDALLEHLAAERIEHEPIETYSNGVRHVKIPDPDGNAIAFAELSDAASDRAPALEPFDALIGTWATEATHPLFDGVVPGSSTFEWLEGGRFLIQRSRNDHELFPDAVSVIGAPEAGEGLVMEYFDSRGVRRTYGVSIDDDELRIWRDHPGFEQRFSARLGRDSFDGLWQVAETAGDWRDDLKVTYRRRD